MENRSSCPVVLASSSPYREALLSRILDDFDCVTPSTDETPLPKEPPAALSLRLARAKASSVAATRPDATVIGSDQVAVRQGMALGKPGGHRSAVSQLLAARGLPVKFLTSVSVIHGATGEERVHTDITEVRFRNFDRDLAERYVERDRPWDCAGGFKAESAGPVLFERIVSQDPTGLLGLPLIWLAMTLEDLGIRLL